MAEGLHAAVYVTCEEERRLAEKLVRDARAGYEGVVEGWLDPDGVRTLAERGIVVDPIDAGGEDEALALPHLERQAHVDADDPRLSDLRRGDGPPVLEPDPEQAPDVAFYHIRLEGPITEEQRSAFVGYGVDLAAFEPPDSYRTRLTCDQYAQVRATPGVRAVERYGLEEKLTPRLVDELDASPGETRTFDLVLHRIADRDAVVERLRELGVEVSEASYLFIRFDAPLDRELVASIARIRSARRLDLYEPPSLLTSHARALVGVEGLKWTGAGELVAVFDSGIDSAHQDFAGQIASVDSVEGASKEDTVGHGTHVAGIVAGTGAASNGEHKGVAPGAKLAIIGFVGPDAVPIIPANWADLLQRAVASGAQIVNLSVGTNFAGHYDFGSLALDEFVWANPEVLVVVAAGNSGVAPEGWVGFHTVGSPASSKNALTVGASDTDRAEIELTWGAYNKKSFPAPPCSDERMSGDPDCPAALSSRGPTDSEAVKPDVLAPGTYILAPRAQGARIRFLEAPADAANGAYGYLGGTSMAAPMVAGCAAVLRQYLREERGLENPSAALLKAILIASARRIKQRDLPEELREQIGYPDFDQGFGRVDLSNVLPHDGAPAARRLEYDDVRQDSQKALASRGSVLAQQTYEFTVADGDACALRMVLAWTDWPSDGVQNNIHLKLTPPGGTPIYGNADHRVARRKADELLERYLQGTSERPPALDKRNNVEQIVLDQPAPGDYVLNVIAENTPKPPQGYALCVLGGLTGELGS